MGVRAGALVCVSIGIAAAALLTLVMPAPASAQGFFDMLFGGFHRPQPPPQARPYAEPSDDFFRAPEQLRDRAESVPASSFCVRTSDGFYFPVQAHAGVSAEEACHAFCPASPTRLYRGAGIDHAAASDGSRYADLDTAYLYRKEVVAGATCNGRDQFGLATIEVKTDPTLRPGDIVATKSGLVAVTRVRDHAADFTPLQDARNIPKSTRARLAGVKIMPPNPGAPKTTPVTMAASPPAREGNRQAQLSR